jgi:hypothetical protein
MWEWVQIWSWNNALGHDESRRGQVNECNRDFSSTVLAIYGGWS